MKNAHLCGVYQAGFFLFGDAGIVLSPPPTTALVETTPCVWHEKSSSRAWSIVGQQMTVYYCLVLSELAAADSASPFAAVYHS